MSSRVIDQTVLLAFMGKSPRERRAIARHLSRADRDVLKRLISQEVSGRKRKSQGIAISPWLARRLKAIDQQSEGEGTVAPEVHKLVAAYIKGQRGDEGLRTDEPLAAKPEFDRVSLSASQDVVNL